MEERKVGGKGGRMGVCILSSIFFLRLLDSK